jgi:hypothetical protein
MSASHPAARTPLMSLDRALSDLMARVSPCRDTETVAAGGCRSARTG